MARKKNQVPAYLLHQATGQARVRIRGKDYYLGPYGSDDSRQRYGKLIAEHCAAPSVDPFLPSKDPNDSGPSVAEICLAYLEFSRTYYVKNGKTTDEVFCVESAVKAVAELFGLKPIKNFGPNDLRAVQSAMIDKGWSRGFINKQTGRVRRMVRWAVSREMVSPTVLAGLESLEPLSKGRSQARETRKRGTVPEASIVAVKAVLRSKVAKSLIDLQRITGARSGELCSLTTSMIDQTGPVWRANLESHKTDHHGHERCLMFGPKAQEIIRPWLKPDEPLARLFPTTRASFANTVKAACLRAGVTPWTPHELRHTRLTEIRDQLGVEGAQAIAGHSKPDMTANYTKRLDSLAESVAGKIG